MIVQPKLSLPARPLAARDVDTPPEMLATLLPAPSWRYRLALVMALTSTIILSLVVTLAICFLTSLPGILKFVGVVILFLVGCSVAGVILWRQETLTLSTEPRLITQRLMQSDTLRDMEDRVTMDTTGYLKSVRLPL
jgi:hypothetical protein